MAASRSDDADARFLVAAEVEVHLGLDQAQLVGCHRPRLAEVEAQPVGGDQRALLRHVRAEMAAEGGVQEVGGGVGAAQAAAALDVDGELDGIADPQSAALDAADMDVEVAQLLQRVGDGDHGRAGADGAGVADLAAQFAIEGRLVGDDQHILAGSGLVDQLAAPDQGQHAALRTVGLVAQELGGAVLVADVEPDALDRGLARALPGGARSLALAGHGGVEAGGIDGTAFGAERVLGEVEREAERVVETEGDLAGEGLAGAEAAGLLLQEPQAPLQRAAEAGLLQAQHLGDQAFGPDQLGEGLAHLSHKDGHHAPQHGLAGTQELGVTHAAAHDPAQHIAAALVGRHDAVGDQEGGGAQVVGDHLVRGLALPSALVPVSASEAPISARKRSIS